MSARVRGITYHESTLVRLERKASARYTFQHAPCVVEVGVAHKDNLVAATIYQHLPRLLQILSTIRLRAWHLLQFGDVPYPTQTGLRKNEEASRIARTARALRMLGNNNLWAAQKQSVLSASGTISCTD